MPIAVQYGPSPALLGQAAYGAGLGVYTQNQARQAVAEEELRQRDRLQANQIQAATNQQLRGMGADYITQGRSLEAQKQRQAEQLLASELGQKRSLAAGRAGRRPLTGDTAP